MTTEERPSDYSDGYGELVRAYRYYMGISQRTLAFKIGMSERSLSDIEVERRRCPRGFINTVEKIVDKFDTDVQGVVDSVPQDTETTFTVTDHPNQEWARAVVGRAAATSGLIRPILESQRHL